MSDALTLAAASLSADLQRLATISHNLANATTPAFRRELTVARSFASQFDLQAQALRGASPMAGQVADGGAPLLQLVRDMRPGTLRFTGLPLDLAIEGEGWFELQADDGPAYTRQGSFERSASGRLVSAQGLPVLGQGGEIVVGPGVLRVDADGVVSEDGKPVGQLKVVGFAQPAALQALGDGLMRPAPGSADGTPLAQPRIRQGHLENANVSTLTEMVRLVETMRHAESSQRVLQNLDDMLGRAIRTLGEQR